MRFPSKWLLAAFLLTFANGRAEDSVFQLGVYDALRMGAYDGDSTARRLKRSGDFGIGTFDGLDGEMVVLNGKVYQVRTDGTPQEAGDDTRIPFAIVTPFHADAVIQVDQPLDLKALQAAVDGALPSPNYIYAVRIAGTFKWIDTRSVGRQSRPYPGLEEALKNQVVFRLGATSGTLAGFRFPPYVGGVNVAGYHFHFLADDERAGGHALDGVLEKGKIEIGRYNQLRVVLPETEGFGRAVAQPLPALPNP